MGTKNRLMKGFGATAVGPLITAFSQVVSVPMFLGVWGPHLYGEWLILSAVPTYLSITDMGFGSVAGNDMTMRVAQGDYRGALETFQSTLLLVLALSAAVGVIICGLVTAAPIAQLLRIALMTKWQAKMVLFFLCVWTLATLQGSLLISGYRCEGQYSFGVMGLNLVRLVESLFVLFALALHWIPVQVAFVLATVRLLGTIALYILLIRRIKWIQLSFAKASTARIRELARPAIAFMGFPAGNAVSIQGLTILLGILLGPVAVATFTPMRTLSRFAYQLIDSIKNAAWPELSAAFGAKDWELARRLHRSCCQIAFWLATLAVSGLAIVGPDVFAVWTHNRVFMDRRCFYLLLIVVIASSLWNTSSAVSIAASLHEQLSIKYLVGTCGSLILAAFLIPHFRLSGAAIALLAADLWMIGFTIRRSNSLLGDTSRQFFSSMVDLTYLKLLWAR